MLDSRNHVLLADEPAWEVFRAEIADFLAADAAVPAVENLSDREREIVRLAAAGLDNAQIADRLTLSMRTVERHFHNAYLKLGLSGRTARAAAVARLLASSGGATPG
jgi:DNA-binding NarL/FixJ family response regulator